MAWLHQSLLAMAPMTLLLLYLCCFLAAAVHTVTGMGGAFLLLAAFSFFLPPKLYVPWVAAMMVVTNLMRLTRLHREIHWPITLWFTGGCVVGALAGGYLFTRMPAVLIARLLGIALLLYVISRLLRWSLDVRLAPRQFVWVGLAAGFLSAVVGAAGVVTGVFLLGFGLIGPVFAATSMATQVVTHGFKSVVYLGLGALSLKGLATAVLLSLALAPAIVLGLMVGRRLSQRWFYLLVMLLFAVVGVRMLLF